MFVQHSFIEDTHRPTLESIIRQKEIVTESYIAKVYKACLDVFQATDKSQIQPVTGLVSARIASATHVVASVTDEKTGFFLQLAGVLFQKNGKQLTVGKKWAMQGNDPSLGTTATKMW